jgi:hypothetical protein
MQAGPGQLWTLILTMALSAGVAATPAFAQSPEGPTAVADSATWPLPTLPRSNVVDVSKAVGSTKTTPAARLLPPLVPPFTDWSAPFADYLDAEYDKWLAAKKSIGVQFNIDLAIDYSFFPQWGTKGNPVYANIYYPSLTWRPFTGSPIGSGEIDVVTAHQTFLGSQDTTAQAARLGLITFANDWTHGNFAWSTLAYTHTLPASLSWLSFTAGQYNLFSFDPSQYAANAQTSFISYSFAQDATETFPYAGIGGYAQIKTPDGQFRFAGGAQGGTDPNGGTLTAAGFQHGRMVSWGNAQWTPTTAGLGAGIYSLLIYEQPFVPTISSRSTGVSFSASQELTDKYGAFLRINNATGPDLLVRTSYGGGGVWNDPLLRNRSDQLGFALGWDKTNRDSDGAVNARYGEWVTEVFYRINVFKGMHVTPDVQVFWNPALMSSSGPVAVFTLRTTLSF